MAIGSVLSAEQIFEKFDMVHEQVECLSMAGLKDKAIKLAKKELEKLANDPKMLCKAITDF